MAGLNIPNYVTPSGVSLSDAYAYNAGVALDVSTGGGRIDLNVHPSKAAADARMSPADQLSLTFGQVLIPGNPSVTPPVAEVRTATLAELMALSAQGVTCANPPVGQNAWDTLSTLFLGEWQKHPALAGATVVP